MIQIFISLSVLLGVTSAIALPAKGTQLIGRDGRSFRRSFLILSEFSLVTLQEPALQRNAYPKKGLLIPDSTTGRSFQSFLYPFLIVS